MYLSKRELILPIVLIVAVLYGCKDEGIVGEQFLNKNKLDVKTTNNSTASYKNLPFTDKDISGVRYGLIGTYKDPVFGSSTAGTAFHLRILSNPNFADSMIFDSAKLFLRYSSDYGNRTTPIAAKVYELDATISFSQNYTQNFDITPLLGSEIGNMQFIRDNVFDSIYYKSKGDPTKDSVNSTGNKVLKEVINQLVIPLDSNFGKDIFYADASYFSSGEAFLDLLKGICILADDSPEKGAIYSFDLLSNGSHMNFYYHYYKDNSSGGIDTTNSISQFDITENSATLNIFKHNNSGTPYEQVLNDTLSVDSFYYLQGMAGSKLYFEIPELNSWKDSTDVVVNQATITFGVFGDSTYHTTYPLPRLLQLNALNVDDDETNLTQQTLNLSNARGVNYYIDDDGQKHYIFLFALYLQEIIKGDKVNNGLELYVSDTEQFPGSVVLYNNLGNTDQVVVKITYTKTKTN